MVTTNNSALVADLQTEIADLKGRLAKQSTLRMKVSEKGALSLYGVHSRFPVTLYREQWDRVLDFGDEIRKFIAKNSANLVTK